MATPKNKYGLTKKAEDFCRWFVKTGKGALSYREAYQSKAKQTACYTAASQLLRNPLIQIRIGQLRKEDDARFAVTQDRIGLEFARLGFADPRDALDDDGQLLPLHKMPEHIARAIQSFDIYEEFDPKTNSYIGRLTKIKLAPKHPALESMARWKQMIVDKLEVSHVHDYKAMTQEQLEKLIADNEATIDAFSRARLVGSGTTERVNAQKTPPKLPGPGKAKP